MSAVSHPSGYALQTQGLVKRFGGITATDHVNLNIAHGARHALIGPNGAGKTTLINLMCCRAMTFRTWRRINVWHAAWCARFKSTNCSTHSRL